MLILVLSLYNYSFNQDLVCLHICNFCHLFLWKPSENLSYSVAPYKIHLGDRVFIPQIEKKDPKWKVVSESDIKFLLCSQKHYIQCQVKPITCIFISWDIKETKLENKVKLGFHCTRHYISPFCH